MSNAFRFPILLLSFLGAPLLVLGVPASGHAGDGRLEINQACATGGGCFAGDASGFPVRVGAPGSYLLTSSLEPGSADAIVIGAGVRVVAIDLNGFVIQGPATGSGTGIRGESGASAITIRNGSVNSMGGDAIDIGGSAVIESVNALGSGGDGFDVNQTSLVRDCRIVGNAGYGIRFSDESSFYRGNVFAANATGSVLLGRAGGSNLCDDALCSSVDRRRYYVTSGSYQGSAAGAPGVCAPGFHFASFFELVDPSSRIYDESLGLSLGTGVPIGALGWFEVGTTLSDPSLRCSGWSTNAGTGFGAQLAFGDLTSSGPPTPAASPWTASLVPCSPSLRVWCAED